MAIVSSASGVRRENNITYALLAVVVLNVSERERERECESECVDDQAFRGGRMKRTL